MDMDNVWELQFSPDGRRLAFTTHGAHAQQLYLYDTTTPEAAPTNIMNDVGRFEFSPDSTKLAFKSHYSYSQLYFYEITTPEIKPISIMKDVRNFHFLLDGRLIVCSEGNRDLRIINLTDGLELIQQIFMLCVLSNERAGHPVTFTRTEINEIDKQQQDFSASHRPLLDLPPDLLEHVHIVG
jgi:dipeptidyl aminopeptidase/acylaminoacyl peptidase